MPQMAPMNWMMLFIMFIIIFMMFNVMNYYCFLYNPKNSNIKQKPNNFSWKW